MNMRATITGGFGLLVLGFSLTVSVPHLALHRVTKTTDHQASQGQDDKNQCHPWQEKDKNDNCVDKPGVEHHHGHYEPQKGEKCWVECLCKEGESPADSSCAPCSYVGVVCMKQ